MTTLVTGGSGFVGGAVLDALVARGDEVRALARSPEAAGRIAARGGLAVEGDLLRPESLAAALDGCEVVYHAAGKNAFCLADPSPLYRVNVDGSRNLVRAAARAGVRRVVYTSSAATLGEPEGTLGREDSPHRGWYLSHYERSKHQAEQAVLAEAGDLEVVVLNPSSVQGPGRTTGTGKLFIDFLRGRLRVVVESRLSIVDVADCAAGHLLAAERGSPGERYILNGATVTTSEALELLRRVTGAELHPRRLPGRVALGAAALVEGASRLARRRPPFCREMVRTMLHGHAYDGSKAQRDLGLRYTPLEETLRRTVAWYVEHGFVALG